MQNDDSLLNLSPVDGRYASVTHVLRPYFSEFALMKYRLQAECLYLEWLSRWKVIRLVKQKEKIIIKNIVRSFSFDDANRIKVFEDETKHDVKALEYFLKEKLEETTLTDLLPFVHFGLTSEDVNTLSYALMLKESHAEVILPALSSVLDLLHTFASANVKSVMVARTHGQPAVPTTFGKELAVFYARVKKLENRLATFRFEGKLNGAVGNYNALAFVFPKVDWFRFSKEFISSLGLSSNLVTTQIIPSDNWVEYFQLLAEVNTIFVGLCQDMWQYISQGLVVLKRDPKQVGSSTMPHKVNPIDFENAEGNLSIANSYFELYTRKLLVSRLQRDLSDSTVKRTIGTALGHTVLAWKSLIKGLEKISFNPEAARTELNAHWEILSEAIQVYLKIHGDAKGYETVKTATMGKQFDAKTFRRLVKKFPSLAKLTPASYSGLAKKLAELALQS
ncbi:MAG: adenylosuccinate lyase [Candidatus Gottesmanbacteria bacterium]|nr:adenylosuccinate lyase [Candidatus Gottesmanbacteria bacterium]